MTVVNLPAVSEGSVNKVIIHLHVDTASGELYLSGFDDTCCKISWFAHLSAAANMNHEHFNVVP